MKIGVVLLARDSYLSLLTVVNAAYRLRSGYNELCFFIRYDYQDETTERAVQILRANRVPVEPLVGPRPETLGRAINETVEVALAAGCEAITTISDDLIPAHIAWDDIIRTGIQQLHYDFFSWKDMNCPGLVTCPIFSSRWARATAPLMPEWFPFWFGDTWAQEVYVIASGKPAQIIDELLLMPAQDEQGTKGMRELAFWVDFWCQTQPLRIQAGLVARHAMGWPDFPLDGLLPLLHGKEAWDVERIEKARGDGEAAGERYARARERAEKWLMEGMEGVECVKKTFDAWFVT